MKSKLHKWFAYIVGEKINLIFFVEEQTMQTFFGTSYFQDCIIENDLYLLTSEGWEEITEQEAKKQIVKWRISC